ncbi:heavy metal-associated domain-containing protein [Nocardia sp. NPDC050793]|uniref:heavy-metal-associated domain-containing protein n=1 Tax=Nocardia sp. NPDC050793 TaxID=3155159 RepID=UPI0033F6675B
MSSTATATTTYSVTGMTCGCCVNKVRDKVGAIPGVTEVGVDLDGATVTVSGPAQADRAAIADAIDRAGFQLTD